MSDLEIRGLRVQYGQTVALRDVNLTVHQHETVGLIGPNGAGKSTLLSAIMGLVRLTDGSISFGGQSLLEDSTEEISRHGIGLVPEGRRIFATMSVYENLIIGASTLPRGVQEDRIEQQLERFPVLRRYRDQTAGRLSGGEQQQLAIARALTADPQLILLDEPSLGLAPQLVDLVFEILAELREDGITVLLVEQNARRTMRFADRTYVLTTGEIQMEKTRDEIASAGIEEVEELYLGGGQGLGKEAPK